MILQPIHTKAVEAKRPNRQEQQEAVDWGGGIQLGKQPSLGLCATCRHNQTCMYLKKQKLPVFHCEEFEIGPVSERQRREATPQSAPSEPQTRYRGLCVNCENRENCIYADTEGGVWHCELYV